MHSSILWAEPAPKPSQTKDNYLLAEGDSYQLAVNGATLSGTVHYTSG